MSLVTQLSAGLVTLSTAVKTLRTSIGDLASLPTTNKSSIVGAITEVAAATGTVPAASTTVAGVVELATTAEATTGTDAVRAVTPAGVKAVADALRTTILGAGVPAALDTLDELAAALGDDANFAATVTTSLAGKQPLDADLTAIAALVSAANKTIYATGSGTWAVTDLTAFGRSMQALVDAAAARTLLGVYSQAEIGDVNTDFAAQVTAALA